MSINYENKMIFFLKDFFLSPPSGFVVVFFLSDKFIYLFIYQYSVVDVLHRITLSLAP